eukprot:jgi/Hompol1/4728/HPOL_003838-RA
MINQDIQSTQNPQEQLFDAELAAGSFVASHTTAPKIRPEEALSTLMQINADLTALKKRGAPQVEEIQALAERTWRANVAYEHRLAQLMHEKQQLESAVEHVWHNFDEVIMPLWKFDESMVPIYHELGAIHSALRRLARREGIDALERGIELRQLQERLHDVENGMIDGKFVPGGWSKFGGRIPAGQAMCVNLMNRCYKIVRKISDMDSIVDPSLLAIHNKLEDIISRVVSLRDAAKRGFSIDPIELHIYQQQVDEIDSLRKDGKFVDASGNIPEGQATLHDLLEWAYDLIHECIVEQEAQDEGNIATEAIKVIGDKMDDVRSGMSSLATTAARGIQAVSMPTFQFMASTVGDGLKFVTDTVTHPIESAGSAVSTVRSVVSSSLSLVSKISEQLEPLDASLEVQHAKLFVIRRTLRDLRTKRNQAFLKARASGDSDTPSIAALNKMYSDQLAEISSAIKEIQDSRVDGKFVNEQGEAPIGQHVMQALLDECNCLYVEMVDDLCAAAATPSK